MYPQLVLRTPTCSVMSEDVVDLGRLGAVLRGRLGVAIHDMARLPGVCKQPACDDAE